MKIRISGTEAECRHAAALLPSIVDVLSADGPRPSRGSARLMFTYVEARPYPPGHGDAGPSYATGIAPSGAALLSAEDVPVVLGALADGAWWQAQHGTAGAAARYRSLARSLGDDR